MAYNGRAMEPRIQYAQTADGVSIAFSTLGKGMPFIQTPVALCGVLQVEWQIPEIRAWDERMAQKRMLVKYDSRGTGLSQRRVADCSLDAMVADVEAVADCLELPSFALMGSFNFGPVAIAYAARHPKRVSHLILWCTYARFSNVWTPQLLSIKQLVEGDWNLYTETVSHAFAGFPAGGASRQLAAMLRKTVTQEEYLTAYGSVVETDVATLLPEVSVPTLVLHRRELSTLSVNAATYLASEIPGAQLAILEGSSGGYAFEDSPAVLSAIAEFLGEGEEAAVRTERPEAGAFRTVLFTDVEGSTALTQRLGDAKARELLREHERMVREALKAHGGSELKTMGDGFMASFSSATRALECSIAMQRTFAARNKSAEEPILVRVGLNAGEPIAEDEDLFGTVVIEAARIAAAAEGGEILVSDVVRQLAKGKDFLFADRGDVTLKGFDEPVRLYEVRWEE
jgi:class 3 adenylate cyclase/pimeloyl-ACP methyl ester carboxylesterase